MAPMTPVTHSQLHMVSDYLRAIRHSMTPGFELRDVVMLRRFKGRAVAEQLHGIALPCKWLERRTDDYEAE